MAGFELDNDRPTVVDLNMTGIEPRGLEIPDVKDAAMIPGGFNPPPDEPEEDDYELEAESEDDSGEEYEAPQVEEEPSPETHGNPWAARQRILQKEKRQKDERIEELTVRLANQQAQMEALIQNLQQQQQPVQQQQTEDIDLDNVDDTNIVEAMFKQFKAIKKEIADLKNAGTQQVQAATEVDALQQVNAVILTQVQRDPAFQEGIKHLSKVLQKSAKRQYPNLPEEERVKIVTEAFNKKKVEWAKHGLDPVEQMMEYAIDYGFNPYPVINKLQKAHQPQRVETPRENVQRSKQKMEGITSIGGVEGTAPQTITARQFKSMDEDKFNYTVNRMIDAGAVRDQRTIGRTPSFSDLLPGKGKLAK